MRHVICFGNELHGDDGFGVRVYEQLMGLHWPDDVELFSAGIAGLNALRLLEDCRQAILVDALSNCGRRGYVYLLRPEELAASLHPPTGHGLGIRYLLEALKIVRSPPPDISIVGVEIGTATPFAPGLSDATERAVAEAVGMIRSILSA